MLKTETHFYPLFSWAEKAHGIYCRRAQAAFTWVGPVLLYLYHDILQLMFCNVVQTQLPSSMQNKMERGWILTDQVSLSILIHHFSVEQLITFCSCSTWAEWICVFIFEPWTVLSKQVTHPRSLLSGSKALPGDPATLLTFLLHALELQPSPVLGGNEAMHSLHESQFPSKGNSKAQERVLNALVRSNRLVMNMAMGQDHRSPHKANFPHKVVSEWIPTVN